MERLNKSSNYNILRFGDNQFENVKNEFKNIIVLEDIHILYSLYMTHIPQNSYIDIIFFFIHCNFHIHISMLIITCGKFMREITNTVFYLLYFSDFQSENFGNPGEYHSFPFVKKDVFDPEYSSEKELKCEPDDVNSENCACGNVFPM